MEKESVPWVGYTDAPRLVRKPGDSGIRLEVQPVPSENLNYGYNLRYLPFSNTYLLWGISISADYLPPAWYFTPDGKVQAISIPKGPWTAASYFGVRPGLFIVSGRSKRFDDPGNAGGYLVVDGQIHKVLTGQLRSTSVAPSGCRVAFIYSRSSQAQSDGYRAWKEGKAGNTIRMIDLCAGRAK
jgi:hypothetical protein